MLLYYFILYTLYKVMSAEIITKDVQFLNELPLDKLLKLKNSLEQLVTPEYRNMTVTTPSYMNSFGAQAMAMQAPPIKRTDYEYDLNKKDSSNKVSHIFSMSVTTLAFLAFGGYLLCLIVQAVKAKQSYTPTATPVQPTTFFVSAGIKKRPQLISSYGRKRREARERSLQQIAPPPEEMFTALLQLCESYVKWSQENKV